MRNKQLIPALLAAAIIAGCTATTEKPETEEARFVRDFPTQDRVEYVLACIEKKGGLRYETLYPCICKIDKIAEKMSYKDYAQAKTFTYLRRTPGEKGGIFRDPPQAKKLRKQLKDAEQYAEDSCVVKMN